MPITTDAVAISKKAVNKFIESDEYRKCKKADLIFAEFLSDDGGKLFLFEPNRVFQVNENEIDEEEFIWVSIDDEDNLEVTGVASIKSTEPYINVEVNELISYPSIVAYGFSGSGANGWNGELELDKKGVSLVSLKSK